MKKQQQQLENNEVKIDVFNEDKWLIDLQYCLWKALFVQKQ